jgi:hypothetical protein
MSLDNGGVWQNAASLCVLFFQVCQATLNSGQSAMVVDITAFFGAVGANGFGMVGFPDICSQKFVIRGARE